MSDIAFIQELLGCLGCFAAWFDIFFVFFAFEEHLAHTAGVEATLYHFLEVLEPADKAIADALRGYFLIISVVRENH